MQAVPLFCKISVSTLGHGCTSRFFELSPAIPSLVCHLLWLRNQICRACLTRHLYALLHPQKSLRSLSFGDPSELLRPIFKYLRASSQDCTNREATDRQQAGRNHTDTRKRNTHAHSAASSTKSPSGVLYRTCQMIHYIVPEQR